MFFKTNLLQTLSSYINLVLAKACLSTGSKASVAYNDVSIGDRPIRVSDSRYEYQKTSSIKNHFYTTGLVQKLGQPKEVDRTCVDFA